MHLELEQESAEHFSGCCRACVLPVHPSVLLAHQRCHGLCGPLDGGGWGQLHLTGNAPSISVLYQHQGLHQVPHQGRQGEIIRNGVLSQTHPGSCDVFTWGWRLMRFPTSSTTHPKPWALRYSALTDNRSHHLRKYLKVIDFI